MSDSLRNGQKEVNRNAREKGWWDGSDGRTFGDFIALFHSELSEAYEEYRNGREITEVYQEESNPSKPEGIPVELADCVIRILDFLEQNGIDLQEVLERKHAYNRTRSYRHGGKRT
jgi:NTP pyrophosphatase (non-canonical NTP hydrolase)